MSKIKNRADLLIAAGESIKMQAAHGIEPVCKSREFVGGKKTESKIANCLFAKGSWENSDYEFPIAVLEGKAVFEGDELYSDSGTKFKVGSRLRNKNGDFLCIVGYEVLGAVVSCSTEYCSWNPPKPKTVQIDVPVEWAESRLFGTCQSAAASVMVDEACRKALGELK